MPGLPLLARFAGNAPFMRDAGGWISQGSFVAQAQALAAALPAPRHALNTCADRYAFTVAFAATLLRGQVCLLPGSPLPAVIAALQERYPDSYVLDDEWVLRAPAAAVPAALPHLDPAAIAAIVFTSGSTGVPQAQPKTLGSLIEAARLISQRLLSDLGGPAQILATVPSQHMFGLEMTTLQALANGARVHYARPQFPDDLRAALAELPEPRVLVTTPVHLRALCAAGVALPPLARFVSATAPLPEALAAHAEARFATQVHEIYGCTEAGSMATRRTVEGPRWRLLGELRLSGAGPTLQIHGGHLPHPVPLQDVVETDGIDGLRLVGRAADLVKVAGKRASAADLTLKLLSIPGVEDGVVFQPDDGDELLQRPAALVVAPGLSGAEILALLGQLVDPVFLPRPLRKVERLPRNDMGKLPRARLLELLRAAPPP